MSPRSYEIQRAIEHLESNGYFTMTNLPYAERYIEALKFKFPDVALVHGVGEYSVGQFIFIPKGRATVLELVQRELRGAKVAVKSLEGAIKKLTKVAASLSA
jgi:hypothetical protein